MSLLVIGVDVSKKTLDVAAKIKDKEDVVSFGAFSNDSSGFSKISKKITKLVKENSLEILIVLEPSGGYEQPFARFCWKKEWRVSMPNPRHVRKWIQGIGVRAKTDQVDACNLARFGAAKPLHDWQPLPEEIALLDRLLKRQDEIKETLAQEKNRLHALDAQNICNGPEIMSIKRSIEWLGKELEQVQKDIAKILEGHDYLKKQADQLQTIPGIGVGNRLFLLVLLSRWKLLTNGQGTNKGITAYVGLDPVHYRSGTSIRKRPAISCMGNIRLRSLLYMGALGAITGNNHLRQFYQRLVSREKHKKVALVAVARKILVLSWSIFRNDTVFDPEIAANT